MSLPALDLLKTDVEERDFTLRCGAYKYAFHTRDRSVRAGRSQLLSGYPSLYVLIGDRQGIVGHLQHDFDTGTHLSQIFPQVRNVHYGHIFSDSISGQSIHQPEEDLVVRIDFDSHDALCVETVGRNVKQFMPGDEVLRNIAGAGWGGFSDDVFKSIAKKLALLDAFYLIINLWLRQF